MNQQSVKAVKWTVVLDGSAQRGIPTKPTIFHKAERHGKNLSYIYSVAVGKFEAESDFGNQTFVFHQNRNALTNLHEPIE